jgi:hypothetical protein
MVFDVRPYEGVGPLVLGMSPEDARAVVGAPLRSAIKEGERVETYRAFTVVYSADNRLVEASFSAPADVRFRGLSLFSDPRALDVLVAADGGPLESVGFIVFPSIGIVLADFDSDQDSDRVVGVFEKGRWDAVSNMTQFRRSAQ